MPRRHRRLRIEILEARAAVLHSKRYDIALRRTIARIGSCVRAEALRTWRRWTPAPEHQPHIDAHSTGIISDSASTTPPPGPKLKEISPARPLI